MNTSFSQNWRIEWSKHRAFYVLILLHTLFLFTCLTPHWINPDSIGLYAYVRSAFFDRDWDFTNEFRHEDPQGRLIDPTPRGRTGTVFGPGTGVLWLPFFLVAHGLSRTLAALGYAVPTDGDSVIYHVWLQIGSCAYGLLALGLIYDLVRDWVEEKRALWIVAAIWTATPFFYYCYFHAANSHVCSAFMVTLFLWVWRRAPQPRGWRFYLGLGSLGGFMALVRWQDGLFLLWPLADLVAEAWTRRHLRFPALHLVLLGGSSLAVFSPQLLYWYWLYGWWVGDPHGSGFLSFQFSKLVNVLFSSNHGLFPCTPLFLLATGGLMALWKRDRRLSGLLLAAWALQTIINTLPGDWTGSYGFGARRFLNCTSLFALGLAVVARSCSRRAISVTVVILALWNGVLMQQLICDVSPWGNTDTYREMLVHQVVVLRELPNCWASHWQHQYFVRSWAANPPLTLLMATLAWLASVLPLYEVRPRIRSDTLEGTEGFGGTQAN